jgi:hypothetical protein
LLFKLGAGIDIWKPAIVKTLNKISIKGIYERNDVTVRRWRNVSAKFLSAPFDTT